MNANRISITSTLLIALSLSTAQAGDKKMGAGEARETLKDIQQSAAMAEDQAGELLAISGKTTVSPDSHLMRLMALKDELNKAGQEITRLESESPAPWERQAIGKALPLLADAASNTQKAIEYFRENKARLWTPEYQGYAERISRDSTEAARTLRDYLSYAQARDREVRLEQRLGMSGE